MERFKEGDNVLVKLGSGAEQRKAVILCVKGKIIKVKVSYGFEGKELTYDGWFKREVIKRPKK